MPGGFYTTMHDTAKLSVQWESPSPGQDGNATNRQVQAKLDGDTWIVIVDNGGVYELHMAAIQRG